MTAYWGNGGIVRRILTLTLGGGEWSVSSFGLFTRGEGTLGTHCMGG